LNIADSAANRRLDDIGIDSARALARQIEGGLVSEDIVPAVRQWRLDFPLPDVAA
jgi:hypothetical protein